MTHTVDARMLLTLLSECHERLDVLNEALRVELMKPVSTRSPQYLIFLDKERAVYAFGVSLLGRLREADATVDVEAAAESTGRQS